MFISSTLPAIEKGWKDKDKNIHFFWGLAGKNIHDITMCEAKGKNGGM